MTNRDKIQALAALRSVVRADAAGLALVHEWRTEAERRGLRGEAFDAAAWALASAGVVALHHHDCPRIDPNHTKWLRRVSRLDGSETFFHAAAVR